MSDQIKEIKLKGDIGSIHYRVPNVLEQLRFFSKSGWYSEECQSDICLRTLKAIEASKEFIVKIEGIYSDIEEILSDRDNIDAFMQLAWDLAGLKLGESLKKP